jgi:hypothetical protein
MASYRFACIADGDVFLQLQISEETDARVPGWVAGLRSGPIIIEVTDRPEVVPGWTWNGTDFQPPSE